MNEPVRIKFDSMIDRVLSESTFYRTEIMVRAKASRTNFFFWKKVSCLAKN